ncbi:MAG: aminopeptidase [archaeon]|nr:aminopeptidase [archaeon]
MPTDLRTQKLAKLLVNYSVFVKPNENIIISGNTEAEPLLLAIYKEVILAGAHPVLKIGLKESAPFFYKYAKKHQIEKYPEITELIINKSHKYIGVGSESNTRELTNCDSNKITARSKVTRKISDLICNNKPKMHRVSTSYPTTALAQEAEMSLNEYENFFYDSCLQDWKKLGKLMDKVKSKFKKNSKVHLIGKNIDLKMQVHGHLAKSDKGEENMPGGEIFMAPVRKSLNGKIKFDYPAIRDGKEVTDIELEFKEGQVINARASKNEDFLKSMLATDENSSYVGELGIGCNPKVNKFTKDLLFDEKIGGTIHLALGSAYKENGGGNDSAIHWDIVKDMKQAKIIVDGKVIQENSNWKI